MILRSLALRSFLFWSLLLCRPQRARCSFAFSPQQQVQNRQHHDNKVFALPPFSRRRPSSFCSTSTSRLHVHVATPFIHGEGEAAEQRSSPAAANKPQRLPRSKRKALERAAKQNKNHKHNRKHNFSARRDALQSRRAPGEGRYDLHSTAVARLSASSSGAEDVMRAIKRAQNLHDVHDIRAIERFLLEQTNASFAYGYKGSLLARLAVAALHMEQHDLARKAMEERRTEFRSSMMPMESAAIIRGLLRVHNVSDALDVLEDELSLPMEGTPWTDAANKDRIKHRALSLASIASRHFFEGEPSMAVLACRKLSDLGPSVCEAQLTSNELNMPWKRLLRGASQCASGLRNGTVHPCLGVEVDGGMPENVVYAVLNAMLAFPADNSDRIYELLSNALVRRTVFVTGAVDMQGCPAADRGEAAFLGRSNVGKSSLINMVTNRKSLAYTSKRPGKTQQFNFFAVNDKVGREKEIKYGDKVGGKPDADSFYMVDLPGFGYAKVPEKVRKQWRDFMHEYITTRETLRVLFHLVDSRHGPTDEDAAIMKQVAEDMPETAKYVVVLTKADKNVKGGANTAKQKQGKVSDAVMNQMQAVMEENGVGYAPVVLTSRETNLGRDHIWKYLKLAAEA